MSSRRKITDEAVKNFLFRRHFKKANTAVEIDTVTGTSYLLLHRHKIAALTQDNDLWIRNAGWQTVTTKERLNGLPRVSIIQRKGTWYLNGMPWNGTPKHVAKLSTDDIWFKQ